MPRVSQHALIWSEEDQHYELHTQGHLISCFRRGDDSSISRWLAQHSAFAWDSLAD